MIADDLAGAADANSSGLVSEMDKANAIATLTTRCTPTPDRLIAVEKYNQSASTAAPTSPILAGPPTAPLKAFPATVNPPIPAPK